ncbi:MAG: di-trans,poly-cis-decaprenylcistransferase [Clostridia bacterium]|nr:di-trans,poly-cis-decaprenylcistransferase [Clostridia bacterium]
MAWFKRKNKEQKSQVVPRHIAFIADGNGRWATEKGLPRFEGHKSGKEAIKKVLDRCYERGIEIVSLFCFSTENFNRPKEEVDYIFNLFRNWEGLAESLIKRDAKFRLMGDLGLIPEDIQEKLKELTEKTADCKTHVLNFGFAYGARHEIVNAVNNLIKDGVKEVTEEIFEKYLYTAGLADPDLIVRASGEQRLSNFMLYQAAYAEFYFPQKYWPDFDAKVVDECIEAYQKRKRRFGKV